VQADQLALTNQVMAQNSSVFGESQGILNSLNAAYQPILDQGPNQKGFSDAENTSLNTEATEGTAQNYANAQKALNDDTAAEGGGNTFEPSGAAAVNRQALAATAAGSESSEQQQILQANYAQGRANFSNAAGVLGQTASTLNPVGTAGTAVNAGTAAANTIASQSNSVWTSVLGALGGIAGSAVGGLTSNLGGGSSGGGGAVPSAPISMFDAG
jgi:hypothetical protein